MWRVIWTSADEWWPSFADHPRRVDAEVRVALLRLHGVTDATIHNLGDTT